ncbi:MAG: hypothetical protein QFX33_04010 [Candidatus Nezhaarchaeota archaeon]|nr:hypothetical protein [Candidatus Nezhaarchaeota archaeon]
MVTLSSVDVSCRECLASIRRLALRRGLWFKVLNQFERAAVELTIMTLERVRSFSLRRVLTCIASKVLEAVKARSIKAKALEVGRSLAERVAQLAFRLGNRRALAWARDPGFIMYLGISWLNTSPIFRGSAS